MNTNKAIVEQAVFAVLHERVSLDLAQVASRALLTPSETQLILDGYVVSGRVRVEGGRYVLAPTSPLADWFAAMCDHAENEPHACNLLFAAHDVALLIRDFPLANTNPGRQSMADNTLLDLDRRGRMLNLPAPDPRVSQLHMQAVTDLFSRWEGNCEAEFTHCDAATELRNALAAACTCRALPHNRRCPSRIAKPEQAHCAVHDFTACTDTCTHPFQVCSDCKDAAGVAPAPEWCRDKACQADGHIGHFDEPSEVANHPEQAAGLAEHVRFISATIGGSYPDDLDPEAHTWRRVMKVAEEVGEVTQALLGHLGENPRKGRTHTLDDLRDELLDVALAALGAVSRISDDRADTVALLNDRAEFVHSRLSQAVRKRVAAIYPPDQRLSPAVATGDADV